MTKKLTITIDSNVYEGLYRVVGAGKISQFIEKLVAPHVLDLSASYAELAQDEAAACEALDWIEGLSEVPDE